MQAWISESFPDEEGTAFEGKSMILHGNREELLAIARFMADAIPELEAGEPFHRHLQDHMKGWSKELHIDIEMSLV